MASFYPSTIKAWHWNYAMFPLTPLHIWWVYQVNTRLHPQETALWINAMLIHTGQLFLMIKTNHKRKLLPFQYMYHCMAYACTTQLIDICQLNSWIQSESHKSKPTVMMPSCTLVAYLDIPPRGLAQRASIHKILLTSGADFRLDFNTWFEFLVGFLSLPDQYQHYPPQETDFTRSWYLQQ